MIIEPDGEVSVLNSLHSSAIRSGFDLWYGWKPYGRYAAILEEMQWKSSSEIHDLQMRKLGLLLEHAYTKVPFYRRRFNEASLSPRDIQTPMDLVKLPILTKQDIQENLNELLASPIDLRHLLENHTGGSTGHPLTFYHDHNFQAWSAADKLRNYRMAGYRLGMRWAFLWGSDYDAAVHKGWWGKFKDRVGYNLLWINTFDLTTDTLVEAANNLVHFQPDVLVAYVSSATLLARLMREKDITGLSLRSIQTSAEVLTAADRLLLEETFGCSVFDRYGCREVNNIAHECECHQGLHLLGENNLVEFLDAEGHPVAPGSTGRIVITNLNNFAMPFIRYENGDMGIPAQHLCSCGRGLPLMDAVIGRTTDVITSPAGKLLHGEFFTHLFYKLQGIQQFRVTQKTKTNLLIQLVPGSGFDQQDSFRFLEDTIHQHGDPAFEVQFELCSHLTPTASGKYRFTISEVPISIS